MKKIVLLALAGVLLVSCSDRGVKQQDVGVRIARYEKIFFDTPSEQLASSLLEFTRDYPAPLLNIYPDDPQFLSELQGFVGDPTMREIYNITTRRYSDLGWLETQLTKAMRKAKELSPAIDIDKFATFVSGYFDYGSRIIADRDSKSLLVSLDQYALGDMENFSYFGLPNYIVSISDSLYLASDIMASVARQYIAVPDEENLTMLDRMIMEGKVLYFVDQVMPKTAKNIKLRYSEEQLEWCRQNESKIWSYFIQNKLLFEKDYNRYHNFTDDAPKTNAFKDSAPRTTDYIGWRIVDNYMRNATSSIAELFANTNSQLILQTSKYKP